VAFRYDRGTLRSPITLPGGRLRVDAGLTRSGVFDYRNPDGSIRREWRPPDEVNKPESLATLVGAPFTDDHPNEGRVTIENADRLSRGSVFEPRMDGVVVVGTISVTSKPVITKMQAGKVQVSCGYECDVENVAGVTSEGERYDCIQRNIQYNHVALVAVGRAGPQASIRMDAAIQVAPNDNHDGDTMDFEKKYLEAVAETAREKARADAAEAKVKEQVARADRAEGERDAAKAELEGEKKARKDVADGFDKRVRDRVELENIARTALGDAFDPKASDADIKRAVVKRVDSVDVPKDKSDEYLAARYDAAVERIDAAKQSRERVTEVTRQPGQRVDANEAPPEVAARKKMIAEQNAPAKLSKGE